MEGWQLVVVRVGLDTDFEDAVRKLRILEQWLAENHRPHALFNADGRPRSDAVCLAVPVARADKALAWRSLCNELGLAAHMVQWRAAPYRPQMPEAPFNMSLD
jgi:hypothetical protein